jgi:two-component system phosphate regulon sensor histidine kinase PhoR
VLELTEARNGRSIAAFLAGSTLLAVIGGYCLRLLRRAEEERELVDAERRLARVSVEEHSSARQRAEHDDHVSRQLIQLLGRELRGPLASIRGFARELQERGDHLPAEQRAEFFGVIRRQSNRLLRVIEDLMLARRLAAGVVDSNGFVPVDVASLVIDTVAEVDVEPTHRLVMTISEELPRVRGEPTELRQALLALIENGIRFSPAGGTIEVVALPEDDCVEISVRDEGVGVIGAQRERLLELLSPNGARASTEEPESGVGLFIVNAVAKRCNGEVRFESAAGRGSVFTLRLPAILGEEDTSVLTGAMPLDRITP